MKRIGKWFRKHRFVLSRRQLALAVALLGTVVIVARALRKGWRRLRGENP